MPALGPPPDFDGRFFTDQSVRSAYSEGAGPYRIVPAAVAVPEHREDLRLLLRYAADTDTPIHPRGAGSGIPGGNLGTGIVIDLARFDRPARVALTETANVGSGVTWATVTQVASHFGFRLPPDPSSGAFCTIGGMVATNAGGARSLSVGSIRPWVRGIEFVTTDGEAGWLTRGHAARTHRYRTPTDRRSLVEHLTAEERFAPVEAAVQTAAPLIADRFPRTRKNAAGYALDEFLASGDLVDLIVGSEGTLGIVTRVELQLQRSPECVGTLLLGLASIDTLGDVVVALRANHPAMIELLDRSFLELVPPNALLGTRNLDAVLLVEFERRDEPTLAAALATARETVREACPLSRSATSPDEREALWALRHAASSTLAALPPNRRSLQVIEDGCVPPEALDVYLRGVRQLAAESGIQVVAFGHAGDGHLHINALVDTTESNFAARLEQLLDGVTALVIDLGGTPSGEHGDGRLRAHVLDRLYGREITDLFARVKQSFDPTGVLNPGVIVPTNGARPLDRLKVGDGADAIPPEVAEGLRRMERTGGWGTSPLNLVETSP